MSVFIAIKGSRHGPPGRYYLGEEGEILYPAELRPDTPDERGFPQWKVVQTSPIGIDFHLLAPYIVEPGFQISRKQMLELEGHITAEESSKKILTFQNENEEIIEGELERRRRKADPSYKESWKSDTPEKPEE